MWFAYAIEHKQGPNLFGTQATDIRVGKLVTFDAPPVHNPSNADKQDICPKTLQNLDVAVNFLKGGRGPVREDESFTNLVPLWSPWKVVNNLKSELAEELIEAFFDQVGRDCIGRVDLNREFVGVLVNKIDFIGWAAAVEVSDMYKALLGMAGDYDRRAQFKRFCGEKKVLADFGCGCGHGLKTNGKCPPKVQYRTEGTCPVFEGLFAGSDSPAIDFAKTIDAEACAEFCTALNACKSWKWEKKTTTCSALGIKAPRPRWYTVEKAKGWFNGYRCPAVGASWSLANERYWQDPKDTITYNLNVDTRGQSRIDVCSEACGQNPGCKSWTYNHAKKECYTFKGYMPANRQQNGFTSGLPKRVVLKNLKVKHLFEPRCCGDHEIWTGCEWAPESGDCPQGYSYVDWDWCSFMKTKAKCRKSCAKKDLGCGCGRTCLLGVPPQGHDGFVRFCENGNMGGKCCDQAGSPTGREFDLNIILGCPNDKKLSSIEIVGDCKVDLYTKTNKGGTRYTVQGPAKVNAGRPFPDNAIAYAKVTCRNH